MAEPDEREQVQAAGRGLIIRPTGVELDKLRPKVILHIHLSHEALVAARTDGKPGLIGGARRFEGVGPITIQQGPSLSRRHQLRHPGPARHRPPSRPAS
jgi:hypothetical protein